MYRDNLKKLRFELKISAQKLADDLGIHKMTISNYENGKREPTYDVLEKLHKLYNVNLNWFVSGKGNMFNSQTKTDLNQLDEDKLRVYFDKFMAEKGLI